jgi:hypothetical protein
MEWKASSGCLHLVAASHTAAPPRGEGRGVRVFRRRPETRTLQWHCLLSRHPASLKHTISNVIVHKLTVSTGVLLKTVQYAGALIISVGSVVQQNQAKRQKTLALLTARHIQKESSPNSMASFTILTRIQHFLLP